MIGIYKITNIVTSKVYIGSSICVERRLVNHKSLLKRNMHHAHKLQNSYNKHGENNFIYNIIDEVFIPESYDYNLTKEYLESLESYYINLFNSYHKGYNSLEEGSTGGGYFKRKKIYQYDLEGNFLKEWDCTDTCSKELLIPRSTLLGNLTNRRYKAKDFIFTYTKSKSVTPYSVTMEAHKRIY